MSPRYNYYAVAKGRLPGVYTTWDEAKEQVTGFSRSEFKGFSTCKEADAFVACGRGAAPHEGTAETSADVAPASSPAETPTSTPTETGAGGEHGSTGPTGRHAAGTPADDATAAMAALNLGRGDAENASQDGAGRVGQDGTGRANQSDVGMADQQDATQAGGGDVNVYCHGACLGNNETPRADRTKDERTQAAYGVWWPARPDLNRTERLTGEKQTNNRAYLHAILLALRDFHDNYPNRTQKLVIYTNSENSRLVCTKYLNKWLTKGFVTVKGKEVENLDLVREIAELRHVAIWNHVKDNDGEYKKAIQLAEQALPAREWR